MTKRIAFLFPGQGAQEVGMGRDLFKKERLAANWIAGASELTGTDLKTLCTRGPARMLDETANLQPALTAVCLSLWKKLDDAGVVPEAAAGHSVGELSALVAAGMAKPMEMVALAATRGRLMSEAASERAGKMVAVSGKPAGEIEAALLPLKKHDSLALAAMNGPSQMTISGDTDAIDEFSKSFSSRGGFKVTRLSVSGAWHSSHMKAAVEPFRDAVGKVDLKRPLVPIIFNRFGETASDIDIVRDLIAYQLIRPVRWDKVMTTLLELRITDFVEIGPGKVLRGLVRLNTQDPAIAVHSVSDLRSLDRALTNLA
jgi:[acyl-carrier-protein] S-malonyltransferase